MIVQFILKKSGVQINSDTKNNQTIDLNVKTKKLGMTGLELACENGHSEVVNILMDNATDLRISVNEKATALTLACMQGHLDVVKNFIQNKVAWNIGFKIELMINKFHGVIALWWLSVSLWRICIIFFDQVNILHR